ncbi:hypothetical protein MRX96_042280 [Rhipicephalus microplus]
MVLVGARAVFSGDSHLPMPCALRGYSERSEDTDVPRGGRRPIDVLFLIEFRLEEEHHAPWLPESRPPDSCRRRDGARMAAPSSLLRIAVPVYIDALTHVALPCTCMYMWDTLWEQPYTLLVRTPETGRLLRQLADDILNALRVDSRLCSCAKCAGTALRFLFEFSCRM